MVKYGVAKERLVYVDLDKRRITTEDEGGNVFVYNLPEDIELSEKWILDHLGEEITILYKQESEGGPMIVVKIRELRIAPI